MMSAGAIREFLIYSYPLFVPVFKKSGLIPLIERQPINIYEAIVKVVVGQMLSRKAANAIYHKILIKSQEKGLSRTLDLADNDLICCGLSSNKVKTIAFIRIQDECNLSYYNKWLNLSPQELIKEVKSHWGMSDWTANMLSIFYLGHEDVFPLTDASINRALNLAHEQVNYKAHIAPEKAKPYRSYLALYLWKALDNGILSGREAMGHARVREMGVND